MSYSKKSYDKMLVDFLEISPFIMLALRFIFYLGFIATFLYFLITTSIGFSNSNTKPKEFFKIGIKKDKKDKKYKK